MILVLSLKINHLLQKAMFVFPGENFLSILREGKNLRVCEKSEEEKNPNSESRVSYKMHLSSFSTFFIGFPLLCTNMGLC